MRRHARLAAVLTLGAAAAGCDDFLTGPGLTENPNSPVNATAGQLFVATQASQFVAQTAQLARLTSMYTQQLSGTNNQQLNWGSQYLFTESDVSGYFNAVYVGGGLVDIRKVRAAAVEAGDKQYEGIAKIWEAYIIGTAASLWGDIPYREAVSDVTRPALDPQQQVYADVIALLDAGIADLAGAGPGPGSSDLVYGGNVDRWRRAANTLKARFQLHLAERNGNAAYTAARTAAQNGINEPPANVAAAVHGQGPGDFRTLHGSAQSDGNIWGQFLSARQDMVAGRALINLLVARGNDPRLAGYFDEAIPGVYRGGNQFGDLVDGSPASRVDAATRLAYAFRQPLITWTENQLILAETNLRLGDEPAARAAVNAVRQRLGMADLPEPVTLNQILEEKYIAQFQNIDAYSDYRRTCYPALTPGGSPPAAQIPRRVPYGSLERLNNPNIPLPAQAPQFNWNDPNACQGNQT